MDQNFDNLSDRVQNLALKMEDGKTELSQILDEQNQRMTILENQSADIATTISNLQLGTSFRKFDHDHPQVRLLLSSLLFSTMFSRRDQIPSSYPDTYQWALKSPEELNQDYHPSVESPNLLEWLREGHGLYWISGKAGSGKSTFLKFVCEQESMRTALNTWSSDSKALIATHFFWSQGNELQRSRTGLLRSILYQLLSACHALITFFGNEHHVGRQEWTESALVDVISAIASQNTLLQLKICLFVDGMDESMGNPTELLDLLCAITSNKNIKCAISSRPWAVFHTRLSRYPHIRLQELTKIDIRRFVSGKINAVSSPVPLSETETSRITDLLVCKAEGVFLWVSLATASILDGIENGDDHDELQSRIKELPAKLKELYGTIITRIEKRYRTQAKQVFTLLLLKYSSKELKPSVLFMSCVDFGQKKKPKRTRSNEVIDLDSVLKECNRTFLHLQQRCGGLLQFQLEDRFGRHRKNLSNTFFKPQLHSLEEAEILYVEFLHRTAFDFFHEYPEVLDISPTESSYQWDPLVARAEGCIHMLEIKIQGTKGPSKFNNLGSATNHVLLVLLSIRCVELDRCTAQQAMLERLDTQGQTLLHLLADEENFTPEVHWCVLLSPGGNPLNSYDFRSGNMTSLSDLCAYSGLVQTALAGLPNLSPKKCTAALNCTLNGLVSPRDGRFKSHGTEWMSEGVLTPSACAEDDNFAIKDFKARTSLISEILQVGGCPNTRPVCVVRELESSDTSSGPRRIHEKFATGETAWSHLLRMLTAEFFLAICRSDKHLLQRRMDTVASWADLIQAFINHHANPRQLVQNLTHNINFDTRGRGKWRDICRVDFLFESEPLPIVASYFQNDVLGQNILNTMTQNGSQSEVHFKAVLLKAEPEFREIFTNIFGLDDPSHVSYGTSWDVSNGVLDHLGTRILSSNQPLWDTQGFHDQCFRGSISDWRFSPWGKTRFDLQEVASQRKPLPHTLEVLREVFIVLDKLQPRKRL